MRPVILLSCYTFWLYVVGLYIDVINCTEGYYRLQFSDSRVFILDEQSRWYVHCKIWIRLRLVPKITTTTTIHKRDIKSRAL